MINKKVVTLKNGKEAVIALKSDKTMIFVTKCPSLGICHIVK